MNKAKLILMQVCVFLFWSAPSFANTLTLVSLEQPPLVYLEKGVVKGITADIVRAVFNRMGQSVEIKIFPFARSLSMVEFEEAHGVFAVVKTPERQLFMDYGNEVLLHQTAVLFVRKSSKIAFDGDLSKLSLYRFGILRGATYGATWHKARKMGVIKNVEEVTQYKQNLQKLVSGRVDILIGPRFTMLDLIHQAGLLDEIKELSPEIASVPTYLAFAKNGVSDAIKQKFEQTLIVMKKEGLIKSIVRRYIGS